jgi:cilia- and flagella-associated protein 52
MSTSLEIDHTIGFSTNPNCLHYHPNGSHYVYCSGWNVGIGHLIDSHSQQFLRCHDDMVTCLTLSSSGSLIASGQCGENSNIYIWSYESGEMIYSFEEHDFFVKYLAFSADEHLLVSIGDENDNKLIIWDISNGAIVASSNKLAKGTTCVCFGGFVKDIKRRNTSLYQLCSGGPDGLYLWQLDPFSGELNCIKVAGDARGSVSRHVTAVTFSTNEEFIYAATSSGDYLVGSVRNQHIAAVIPAAKKGLFSLVSYRDGLITGGGDGTLRIFSDNNEIISETSLSGPIVSLSVSFDSLEVLHSPFSSPSFPPSLHPSVPRCDMQAIAATGNGSIYRVNLSSMNSIPIAESHTASVIAVSFSTKYGDRFATAGDDATIRSPLTISSSSLVHPSLSIGSGTWPSIPTSPSVTLAPISRQEPSLCVWASQISWCLVGTMAMSSLTTSTPETTFGTLRELMLVESRLLNSVTICVSFSLVDSMGRCVCGNYGHVR